MTDDERTALVEEQIAARHERWARETKHCSACGYTMLGGVPGDLAVLECTRCGQRVPKYRLGLEPTNRQEEP